MARENRARPAKFTAQARVQLGRRGFELPAALAGVVVAEGVSGAAVPAGLVQAVVTAATTGVAASASVGALAETALTVATFSRLRVVAALLMAISFTGGVGLVAGSRQADEPPPQAIEPNAESRKSQLDLFGDPLPTGAKKVAREAVACIAVGGREDAVLAN